MSRKEELRALVTGASGFTGRALCQVLTEQGLHVFAASRAPAGVAGTFLPLPWPCTQEQLTAVLDQVRPDYLFHLAGVAHGVAAAPYYEVNTSYAAALLDALRRLDRPCSVLLVGTSAEYGRVEAQDLPIKEELRTRPYGHYGISKLAQTQLGLAFDSGDLRVTVARTFNLVGPGMPPFLSVQAFIDQLIAIRYAGGGVLKVGNVEPSRDFLHVATAAEAYWRLIRAPAARGRVVNVCSGVPTRIGDIVDALVEIAGRGTRVQVDPARVKPIDIPSHYGDNTLLRSLTGMTLRLDLRAALEEAFTASLRAAGDDHGRDRE